MKATAAAAALVLSAVAFATAHDAPPSSIEAAALGTRSSEWGDLPVYFDPAPIDWFDRAIPGPGDPLDGIAVIDVLFDQAGEIRETAVVESSGSKRVDAAIERAFRRAELRRQAPPLFPPRYVVRYTAAFWTPERVSRPFMNNPDALPKLSAFGWRDLHQPPVQIRLKSDQFVLSQTPENRSGAAR